MQRKSYKWLVNRQQADQEQSLTKTEIVEEGVMLRFERCAFGEYASVDMIYVDAVAPFKVVPTDVSHGESGRGISFAMALTGRAEGRVPKLGEFVVDSQWGLLCDFSEGDSEFIVPPGEPLRTLGGTLSVDQIATLFAGEGFDDELEKIAGKPGILNSFSVSPAMRHIVSNALATPLIGPLRRLYLEGTVLQLFALIFQSELLEPIRTDHILNERQAERKCAVIAADLLTEGLTDPPTLLELSQATGLSARKLSSVFKDTYSMNMVEYLADQRLQVARDLMHDQPDYPLKVLAQDVGYNHVSNFSTAFKRKFGLSPAAYIKTIR